MPNISLESATGTLLRNTQTDIKHSSTEASKAVASKEDAKPSVAVVSDKTDEQPPTEESTRVAVEKLQTYADQLNRDLEFSVDDSSGRTVVTVLDRSTEEVIRQIPSEEALRLAGDIDNGGAGLFDARV